MTLEEILAELRAQAYAARDQLRAERRTLMIDLADQAGVGDWYREDLRTRKRRAKLVRELAIQAYWGVPLPRPIFGGICGA